MYLFAFWFNRLIMEMATGLAPPAPTLPTALLRGALVGLTVSFAFFVSTGLEDIIGLLVGAVYGMIIEYAGIKFGNTRQIA